LRFFEVWRDILGAEEEVEECKERIKESRISKTKQLDKRVAPFAKVKSFVNFRLPSVSALLTRK
jgi:hypothetical protein